MKEKVIDFGNERVSVLFKKLFFPTLLGMLSMSAEMQDMTVKIS